MSKLIDLTGERFGVLTVIRRAGFRRTPNGTKRTLWECKCDCGNTIIVPSENLRSGNTKSCGCKRYRTGKDNPCFKNGYKSERLYWVWSAMKQRCLNSNNDGYKNYGERGIKVCEEWKDYEPFRKWAYSTGYDKNANKGDCTLDRIDVNGNYEPDNCRWVDRREQTRNQRKTIWITHNGETRTRKEWAELLHTYGQALQNYLDRGHTMMEAEIYFGEKERKRKSS